MKDKTLREHLADSEALVRALQEELTESNRGLVALHMELDERVEQRTAELARVNQALRAEIAERRRAEEERERLLSERKKQSQFLESLIDNAPIGVAVVDRDMRYLLANPAYRSIAGGPDTPVVGRTVGDVFPPEVARIVEPFVQNVLNSGEPLRIAEYEAPVRGQTWWNVNEIPLRDEAGTVEAVLILTEEVTERKRAEEELRRQYVQLCAARAELEAAINGMTEGLNIFDMDGNVLRMNAAGAAMLGYRDQSEYRSALPKLVGIFELRDRDGRVMPLDKWPVRRILRGEPVQMYVAVVRRLDTGRSCVLSYNGSLIRNSAGDPILGVLTFRDITERIRQEERTLLLSEVTSELLASDQPQQIVESLCRKVMAHLDCDVFFNFLVDKEHGRLRLNAWAGVPAETAAKIEYPDYGVAVCGCAARDGCPIVAEHVQTTRDPRADLVRSFGIQAYACHPLLNQGQVIGTLSFGSRLKPTFTEHELALMKTVTDQVAIAMQRLRLMQSLEEHARAAEAANAAKSQFLANMSHELRTPMSAILGMIDLALSKAKEALVTDCLHSAKGSADLLLTLLNDLLDSAKIESGKLELESAPFSLRRMLDQITVALSVRATEKGLSFSCRVPPDTPDVFVGDQIRLQQVLLNLAGNAIKFTDHGEVDINVRFSSQDGAPYLELSVRDTGIGISPSDQERLFQPFTQADASMARRYGGTGLGLSISKSLVGLMGGRIWVESEPGKGSTFYFTVQAPPAKEAPSYLEATSPMPAAAETQLRLLLVEDNPGNQKLITYILRDRGHLVEIAADGQQAIKLVSQNQYDVILMDVQLPGMDGIEATKAIRRGEVGGNRLPIVAMTAHAMKGDRERCLAAGMDAYLSKPVNAQEMVGLVERLAHGIAQPDPTGPVSEAPEAAPRPETPVFDAELALLRCFNSREMVREMINCFLQETDGLFRQMREALKKEDITEVGHLGHRIKGTVVFLGAQAASDAAIRVEQLPKETAGPDQAEKAVNSLENQCSLLKAMLAHHPLAGK